MRLIVRKNDLEKHAGLISRFQKSGWEIVVR
jgi:hypothetical protein